MRKAENITENGVGMNLAGYALESSIRFEWRVVEKKIEIKKASRNCQILIKITYMERIRVYTSNRIIFICAPTRYIGNLLEDTRF